MEGSFACCGAYSSTYSRRLLQEAIGPGYRRSALEERGDGVYIAKAPEPAQGWVAYFIELTFPSGGLHPFKFTTGVRVAPDVLPFGPPPEMASSQHGGSH